MSEPLTTIEVLYGYKELSPLQYRIKQLNEPKWFGLLTTKTFVIESDFVAMRGFDSIAAAHKALLSAGVRAKDIQIIADETEMGEHYA